MDKPNILLIMTDQQRFDSLGCYGSQVVPTPNLDRLAEQGVLFTNAYVTNPVCTPNRASIFTGKHLPGHGVYRLHDNLPEDEICFPYRLRQAGYETALIGKFHVSSRLYEAKKRHPYDGFNIYEWCHDPGLHFDSAFNEYSKWLASKNSNFYKKYKHEGKKLTHIPRKYHMTHWVAERTINFIKQSDKNIPFFCAMSLFDPHDPYADYPEEMVGLINEGELNKLVLSALPDCNMPDVIKKETSYLSAFDPQTLESMIKTIRKGYYSSIALIDLEVGRVLKALEDKGIENNTLVIFTSDHGDMLGDHHLLTKGPFFYDPCVKVPMIINWPEKIKYKGQRISGLVQSQDIAATILAAANICSEELMLDGYDIFPLVTGKKKKLREEVFCSYRDSGLEQRKIIDFTRIVGDYSKIPIHCTMIREQQYKMNVFHYIDEVNKVDGEIYDMDKDPNELKNLWNNPEYLKVKEHLMQKMINWFLKQELKRNSKR